MTGPKIDKERLHLLFTLLGEFNLHAISKNRDGMFVSLEEVCERVLYSLHDQAHQSGGSMVKAEGGHSVILHGEFNISEALDSAITNNRQTDSHRDKLDAAIAKFGRDVCELCYGEKKLFFWAAQSKPKIGYERDIRPCPLCCDSFDNLGEDSEK